MKNMQIDETEDESEAEPDEREPQEDVDFDFLERGRLVDYYGPF